MNYIIITDKQELGLKLTKTQMNSTIAQEYYEKTDYFSHLKIMFEDNIIEISPNSYLIKSTLESEELMSKILNRLTGRGHLHQRPLKCEIYLFKVDDYKHFSKTEKLTRIKGLLEPKI
jgi:hypothetical protein